MLKRIPLKHTMNTRDLGGLPVTGGGVTRYGSLLRSDAPERVEDDEATMLLEMGITTVLDLRGEPELERRPCFFASRAGFEYHNVALYDRGRPEREEDVPELYFGMVDERETMMAAMKIIAAAPNGVLFHCAAGKDRTGVLAALLLQLAGVREPDIVADYQVSYTYIKPMIQQIHREWPEMPLFLGRSYPEFMEGFLHMFRAEYGSAEEYLNTIGLSGPEIAALRAKLI